MILPCSAGAIGSVASGISNDLLTRAADVMLKERRTLVVVPRETPLSVIHLENLTSLARAGALVLPAMPAFYGRPQTLEQAIDTVVARIFDHLGLENELVKAKDGSPFRNTTDYVADLQVKADGKPLKWSLEGENTGVDDIHRFWEFAD